MILGSPPPHLFNQGIWSGNLTQKPHGGEGEVIYLASGLIGGGSGETPWIRPQNHASVKNGKVTDHRRLQAQAT